MPVSVVSLPNLRTRTIVKVDLRLLEPFLTLLGVLEKVELSGCPFNTHQVNEKIENGVRRVEIGDQSGVLSIK